MNEISEQPREPSGVSDRSLEAIQQPSLSPIMSGGCPRIAWGIVILAAGFLILNVVGFRAKEQNREFSKADLIQPTVVGKMTLTVSGRSGGKAGGSQIAKPQLAEMIDELNTGPLEQRLCCAILLNEVSGHEPALGQMEQIRLAAKNASYTYSDQQSELENILVRLFRDYGADEWTAPTVSLAERKQLEEKLGWFGVLALNPEQRFPGTERQSLLQQADYSSYGIIGGIVALFAALLVGSGILVVAIVLFSSNRFRARLVAPSNHGGFYVEAFACWLLLFIGTSFLFRWVPLLADWIPTSVAMMIPLVAVGWPWLRGVSWASLRKEIGLSIGNPLREIGIGLVAYLAMLPILLLALSAVMLAMSLFTPVQDTDSFAVQAVSHPVIYDAVTGDYWTAMFSIFFMAVVVAPIVEEIMFRGFLYRHLRDVSSRMAKPVSVGFSIVFNSLVFAAIHPQGLMGIPILMILAIWFSLVREWRGSLLAPMTMHAANNFGVTLMLAVALI